MVANYLSAITASILVSDVFHGRLLNPPLGVTSVIGGVGNVFVGGKNGNVYRCNLPFTGRPLLRNWRDLNDDGMCQEKVETAKKKYPIFSLCYHHSGSQDKFGTLFCGGGNRYVSVWAADATATNDEGQIDLAPVQHLGPHTGWVKDLVYIANDRRLYSIGCNCVEMWEQDSTTPEPPNFVHIGKRTIQNSPKDGSTLSSDLLCLALHERGLLGGGVDGRLHLWTESHTATRIHDGRVNALFVAPVTQLIFSSGHDGRLVASRIDRDGSIELIAALRTCEETDDKNDLRILASACINDTGDAVYMALGTNIGSIVLVRADKEDNLVNLSIIVSVPIPSSPTIHALTSIKLDCEGESPEMDQFLVVAGHANGISQFCLSIESKR